jgi:PPOX class probable F420-dependent enzyme
MSVIPDSHTDLLERPLFAHFATSREDGWPQVNPMWFAWDGTYLKLTGTTIRYKYKNITRDPKVALSINDPDEPYRYLEVRGTVTDILDDHTGAFFATLASRYGMRLDGPPGDVAHRIVYVIRPDRATFQ